MKKMTGILSVLLAAACLIAGGCSHSPKTTAEKTSASSTDELKILTIGTADSGGTMYPVGKALAQVISDSDSNIKVNISASNGSYFNVRSLGKEEIDLGLVSGDVAFAAVNGKGEFEGNPQENLRVIAAVYSSLSNWIAPSSLGISDVHDLKGKRIGIGPEDSTTESSAKIVMETLGISEENSRFKNCGLGSGTEEIVNGTLDAIHGFAGIPIQGLGDLADKIPCTVLRYTDQELRSILRENSFFCRDVIPAGTYKGQEEDIPTFGIKCLLCVNASMDEDLVYELTKILAEHTESLSGMHAALSSITRNGFMYEDLPIVLHPGAERYYRENGLLTD